MKALDKGKDGGSEDAGSPPTPTQAAEQGQLLDRMIKVTILNSVLLLFTAACMATARYM